MRRNNVLTLWDTQPRPSSARTVSSRGLDASTIPPRYLAKGNYFTLTGRAPFRHLIYPVPEPGGLGVHRLISPAKRDLDRMSSGLIALITTSTWGAGAHSMQRSVAIGPNSAMGR